MKTHKPSGDIHLHFIAVTSCSQKS